MTRFYNKILEFPVVRYWKDASGDGSMINVGGNIIELFSKRGAERHYNKQYFGNCSLSIRVKDVRKLHDKFSRKNIKIGNLEQMEWGDNQTCAGKTLCFCLGVASGQSGDCGR